MRRYRGCVRVCICAFPEIAGRALHFSGRKRFFDFSYDFAIFNRTTIALCPARILQRVTVFPLLCPHTVGGSAKRLRSSYTRVRETFSDKSSAGRRRRSIGATGKFSPRCCLNAKPRVPPGGGGGFYRVDGRRKTRDLREPRKPTANYYFIAADRWSGRARRVRVASTRC